MRVQVPSHASNADIKFLMPKVRDVETIKSFKAEFSAYVSLVRLYIVAPYS